MHASENTLSQIRGKGVSLLGALFAYTDQIITPSFTTSTMVIPNDGVEQNGIVYGSGFESNQHASIFSQSLISDPATSPFAATMLSLPDASRSMHPILSFTGVNLGDALYQQTVLEPLAPVRIMAELGGWEVFFGSDHSQNLAIHFAEKEAGRKQFIRWAMTRTGIIECTSMPGCSRGFNQVGQLASELIKRFDLGTVPVMMFPIKEFVEQVAQLIQNQPDALLCDDPECLCCNDIRTSLK